MTNRKSKPQSGTRLAARKTGKSKMRARSVAGARKSAARPDTKHARIIAMLRAPAGATVAAIVTAVKWQPHSVRKLWPVLCAKSSASISLPNKPTKDASTASETGRLHQSPPSERSRRRNSMRKDRRSELRLRLPLKTRSRICAVSISRSWFHDG